MSDFEILKDRIIELERAVFLLQAQILLLTKEKQNFLGSVQQDLLFEIVKFLPLVQVATLQLVCKDFKRIFRSSKLWKPALKYDTCIVAMTTDPKMGTYVNSEEWQLYGLLKREQSYFARSSKAHSIDVRTLETNSIIDDGTHFPCVIKEVHFLKVRNQDYGKVRLTFMNLGTGLTKTINITYCGFICGYSAFVTQKTVFAQKEDMTVIVHWVDNVLREIPCRFSIGKKESVFVVYVKENIFVY